MSAALQPGVCRYCGCTEDNACRTPPSGEPCCWVEDDRTVCSGWNCQRKYRADQRPSVARKTPAFRIDPKAGRVRRFSRKKKKGGKAA